MKLLLICINNFKVMYQSIFPLILLLAIGYVIHSFISNTTISIFNLPEIWLYGTSSFILPTIFFNLVFDINIEIITFSHMILGILCLIYIIFECINNLEQIKNNISNFKLTLIKMLSIIFSVNYIFLQLIFPLRGWDALNFYLPTAMDYFLFNNMEVTYNFLTLVPMFKSPVNSLLFSYNLFLNNEIGISLIHVFYFFMIGILIMRFFRMREYSNLIQMSAYIVYLTSPIIFTYFHDMSYYQDHIVGFYFSLALMSIIDKNKIQNYQIIFMISSTMAIMSKISGYGVLIIALFLILKNKNHKLFNFSILIFYIFLAIQTIARSYIEILITTLFLLIMLIQKNEKNSDKSGVSINEISWTLIMPLIFGFIWYRNQARVPVVIEKIKTDYFLIDNFSFNFFEPILIISNTYYENNHSINIINIIFVLFINYWFMHYLLIPKIIGLIELMKFEMDYFLWIVVYFSIWLVYDGTISMRYLFPILVPINICIIIGLNKIWEQFRTADNFKIMTILCICLVNLILYYPLFPISDIFQEFNVRIYGLQKSISTIFILISTISVFLIKISSKVTLKKNISYLNIIIMIIILIAPISYQTYIIMDNEYRIEGTDDLLSYDNRKSVKELSEYISLSFSSENDIGIGFNVPGVALSSKIPILDIMTFSDYFSYDNSNISNYYQYLEDNGFTFIITLMLDHTDYDNFEKIKNQYIFFMQPSLYTELIYVNNEFGIWIIRN